MNNATQSSTFTIDYPKYEPGHVEMFYADELTTIATCAITKNDTKLFAEFVVNGEFDFEILNKNKERIERIRRSEDITPEIEALIVAEMNNKPLIYNGVPCEIEWNANNWFETIVFEENDGDIYECDAKTVSVDVGPTLEDIEKICNEALETYLSTQQNMLA